MTPRKIAVLVIVLIVLIGSIVLIGYLYRDKIWKSKTGTTSKIEQKIIIAEKVKQHYPDATSDEQLLLTRGLGIFEIATDASMLALAEKVAVIGGKIEINDCRFNPIILKVQPGEEFKLKNNGDRIEYILLGDKEYEIASNGGELKIKANFKRPHGLFPYRCGRPNIDIHGLIYIPEK